MTYDDDFAPGPAGQDPFVPRIGFGTARQPPEESVRSCAELKLWLKLAKPNEERRYATGAAVANDAHCSETLREYVMALAERGFLTPHRMRGTDGVAVYLVKRTRRPLVEGQL